jgi:hypothetical protein
MRLGSRGCHEQRSPGRGCRTRLVRALIDAALQSLNGSPELPQNGDHVLRLPEWLPRWQSEKTESVEDRCRTAAV